MGNLCAHIAVCVHCPLDIKQDLVVYGAYNNQRTICCCCWFLLFLFLLLLVEEIIHKSTHAEVLQ